MKVGFNPALSNGSLRAKWLFFSFLFLSLFETGSSFLDQTGLKLAVSPPAFPSAGIKGLSDIPLDMSRACRERIPSSLVCQEVLIISGLEIRLHKS